MNNGNFGQYIKKNGRLAVPLIIFVMIIIVFCFMFRGSRNIIGGEKTTGTIIRIDTSISEGKTLYRPIYEFSCNGNKHIDGPIGYSSTNHKIGTQDSIRCNHQSYYIDSNSILGNILGGSSIIFGIVFIATLIIKLYKKYLLRKKLYSYGYRINCPIDDIYETGNITNNQKEYKISCHYENFLFESEGIIHPKIRLLKSGENIDILVMDKDNPIEYLMLREEKLENL